jgi:hypothetical protein
MRRIATLCQCEYIGEGRPATLYSLGNRYKQISKIVVVFGYLVLVFLMIIHTRHLLKISRLQTSASLVIRLRRLPVRLPRRRLWFPPPLWRCHSAAMTIRLSLLVVVLLISLFVEIWTESWT